MHDNFNPSLGYKKPFHPLRYRLISSLLAVILVFFAVSYSAFRIDYVSRVRYVVRTYAMMQDRIHNTAKYKVIDVDPGELSWLHPFYVIINIYPEVTPKIKRELKKNLYDGPWILFVPTDRVEGSTIF